MSPATTRWEVGFGGIGSMGWPMAARLVRAGHGLRVYDEQDARAAAVAREVGGDAEPSLRALAHASDAIVTMLPTSAIVARVLQNGDDNLLVGMRAGAVLLEMSSGVPSITQRLADMASAEPTGPVGSTLVPIARNTGSTLAEIRQQPIGKRAFSARVKRRATTGNRRQIATKYAVYADPGRHSARRRMATSRDQPKRTRRHEGRRVVTPAREG